MIQLLMAAATIWTKGEHRIFWHISRVIFGLWTLAGIFNALGLNDPTAYHATSQLGWGINAIFAGGIFAVAHMKLRGTMTEAWLRRAKIFFWIFLAYGVIGVAYALGALA